MVKAMNKIKLGQLDRLVRLVQPQASMKEIETIRHGKAAPTDEFRMKQLDNLLNGARNACYGLGAEFEVWIQE